jgi:hypothetical protein
VTPFFWLAALLDCHSLAHSFAVFAFTGVENTKSPTHAALNTATIDLLFIVSSRMTPMVYRDDGPAAA